MTQSKLFSLSKLDRCVQFKRARMHKTTEWNHTSRLVLVSPKVVAGSSAPPRNFSPYRKCGFLRWTMGFLVAIVATSGCGLNRVSLQTEYKGYPIRIELDYGKQDSTAYGIADRRACE